MFSPFIMMVWDGLVFFSTTGFHKLKRMKNPDSKPKWWDKYNTPKGYLFGCLYLTAIVLVAIFEVSKYGLVKSTKVDLVTRKGYEYEINLGLPIMIGYWLQFDQLADYTRKFQAVNWQNATIRAAHPLGTKIPRSNDLKEWSWADKQFLNFFICDNMRVKYEEMHLFDPTFYPVESWTEHRQVDFKCIPMSWRTKWLRVLFVIPKAGPEVKNWNTNQSMRDYCFNEEGSFLTTDKGYLM
jgi:hypothetical protein